jgi:hypothetical protein
MPPRWKFKWTSSIQAPYIHLVSLFPSLRCTKGSNQARGTCICLVKRPVFTVRSYYIAQHLSWRTTPCWPSTMAYSSYSQLPSILEVIPPFTTCGPAMMWWQEPTYHGTFKGNHPFTSSSIRLSLHGGTIISPATDHTQDIYHNSFCTNTLTRLT